MPLVPPFPRVVLIDRATLVHVLTKDLEIVSKLFAIPQPDNVRRIETEVLFLRALHALELPLVRSYHIPVQRTFDCR